MISLPFDSAVTEYDEQGYPIYDRASNSEQLRTMLSKNFTDGVYPNPSTQFQVSTGTDMTVTVNPGACNIQGAFAYETNNRVLIVQAADTRYDRIDRVVLRLNTDTSYRNIDLYVIEGTPASTPVAPALSRTSGIWDIGLANLFIAKNTTSISSSRITDTRLDKDVCGVVSGTIQSVDTSTIFAQYQAALDEYLELVERAINDTEAGYLQNQIDDLSGRVDSVLGMTSTKLHRSIFRGKYLGTAVTTEQLAHIKDGTFEDLWLGDYWTINGYDWVIGDLDYWYNMGDTAFSKHHLLMIPRKSLYKTQMNTTNVTTGGYVGSAMYTSNLGNAKAIINNAFGSKVLTHREFLVNAVSDGKPSASSWYDSTVELMTECMVYGHREYSSAIQSIDKMQIALFQFVPTALSIRENIWLRDVVSAAYFASVYNVGLTSYNGASGSLGVLPAFPIG